ncbi:WhiB family transcriptional regulator (plasmid) [Rhodococcus sp. H-CA8f]|uniref:WhiB family transcriptional regulator n=1 Tax=Rhodococcus sp. H-CA8f TaxID=1727214 RepID=UPI000BE35E96|nr:WhiB family transcriptional regulator [Rhodococcus sp. H-CA8f]ATI36395.1 WhiB family transcriptional regulator [Rhodococcus sp. H-CA8f]
MIDDYDWWPSHGTCGQSDNRDIFHPEGTGDGRARQRRQAIAICQSCPVRQRCLDHAVRTGQRSGVWGGVDMSLTSPTRSRPIGRAREPMNCPEGSAGTMDRKGGGRQ